MKWKPRPLKMKTLIYLWIAASIPCLLDICCFTPRCLIHSTKSSKKKKKKAWQSYDNECCGVLSSSWYCVLIRTGKTLYDLSHALKWQTSFCSLSLDQTCKAVRPTRPFTQSPSWQEMVELTLIFHLIFDLMKDLSQSGQKESRCRFGAC